MKLNAIAAATAANEAQAKIRAKGHSDLTLALFKGCFVYTCCKCGMRFKVRPPAPPKRRLFVDSGWFLEGLGRKRCAK